MADPTWADPTCSQVGCDRPGVYRFTWPGRDEAVVCKGHVDKLRWVARALGMHLQTIPVWVEEGDGGLVNWRENG